MFSHCSPSSDYLPDLITNRTLDLIEDMKDRSAPFMAVLGFPAPHGPEDAAPQYQELFHNVTSHHTPAYNLAPNPDKQWILRHTEEMLPVHKVSEGWLVGCFVNVGLLLPSALH